MTILAQLDLCAHIDGYALWFDDQIVDVFPNWDAAARGRRAALTAMQLLDTTLGGDATRLGGDAGEVG